MRGRGWAVHLVADVFPQDAQDTADEEWITHGISQGWALLTQDDRIRYRAEELAAVAQGSCVLFCLSSANLTVAAKAERFHRGRAAIHRVIARGGPAFYKVYEDRIEKKWP